MSGLGSDSSFAVVLVCQPSKSGVELVKSWLRYVSELLSERHFPGPAEFPTPRLASELETIRGPYNKRPTICHKRFSPKSLMISV